MSQETTVKATSQPAAGPAVAQPAAPAAGAAIAGDAGVSRNTQHGTSNPLAFQTVDFTVKGYHQEASVTPDQVVAAAEQLDNEGFALDTITGVDWIAEGQMELVYDYFHPAKSLRVVVRTRIPRNNPEIPTISKVFPGANWHERETHDFFGIRFLGHPDLTPFLLPEDATYHPLRKDFTA